ncbi:hypothetical protein GZH47_04625 [Paenibacillus rhizovicinus]|uniref:Nucleotidyl transferase AbiEii/AbiGii toxin family protein n=1 Tax=Paenibacillus rhizovicinus TaxID=2704463 RepID=A0A6C0NVJ1_9BACL|nr:hypothetical protein [Paenibacillus rhizovicinus]QHW30197.1 hypothetical protein GZH47_04625 [Paenibacillus rhizovicinus]
MTGPGSEPIAESLENALAVIAGAVSSTKAKWLVGGSTGLLLRGLELPSPPRDLDLYADDEAAKAIHKALKPYAVDEQQLNISPIYRSLLSHYDVQGVQVELVGGFVVASDTDRYTVEVEDILEPLRTTVAAGRHDVGIVPLAHEFCFNLLRGRSDRVELIGQRMREELGLHEAALRLIAARNRFSAALQHELTQFLNDK